MTISERIHHIQNMICQAEGAYHRQPGSVQLLAVSKGQPIQAIQKAFAAGLKDFGENYLQEAEAKIQALSTLPIRWHFIGSIQSNKIKRIACNFTWVHGVFRLKVAKLLNEARPQSLPPLNICLQINFNDENKTSGIHPKLALKLASDVIHLPKLRLRGLMIIPKQQSDKHQQYTTFSRLTQLLHSLNQQLNTSMDTLSMGMSDDFSEAIRAGSTFVRIGRAIFGKRPLF